LPITEMLVKKAGLQWHEVEGSLWQHHQGKLYQSEEQVPGGDKVLDALQKVKQDIPIAQFIDTFFADDTAIKEGLKSYVEGYYAGDIERVSTLALKEELEESDDVEYRIEGGYKMIIDFLVRSINEHGGKVALEVPVTGILWGKDHVTVNSLHRSFKAKKVIITVPLGVLQAHAISFTPALPQLQDALDQLGYGTAIKIILSFETSFWQERPELKDLGMLFSEEIIPTWWTQYPKEVPVLVGWVAGGQAKNLVFMKREVLLDKALQSLSAIFDISKETIKGQLKGWYVNNWDKGMYARGAYSYDTIKGGEVKETMKTGIENTLFFAGEGWFHGLELGTVEAALHNGRDTARYILAHF
ncbi:MAG TPA: NAD(P)/FAD-dependent oxidoreductase, partial [Flavisolibacter sp.]|nr:NAD(P)/FAD-dependent oxidoreductase [Flavisolibacter sp.]